MKTNLLHFGLALTASAAFATGNDGKTIWQPGNAYHTHIAYEISIDNAELEPGAEKSYHGRYKVPHLMFAPVIEFTTSDIVRNGENFFAQRYYFPAYETVSGLDKVKWESDNWMINPRRWARAVCRYRDEDIEPMRDAIKAFEAKESELEKAKKGATGAEKNLEKARARLHEAEENEKKEMDKLRKRFDTEEAEAKKELEKLQRDIDKTEEGSKKRAKAEARIEKAKKRFDADRAKAEARLGKARAEHEKERNNLQSELDKCKERVQKCRAAVRQSLPTETFPVFFDAKHNAVPFSTEKQKVFLRWDGRSIDNYFANKRNGVLDVRIGPMEIRTAEAVANGWATLQASNPSIHDTIASEFGVTASAIFDDPTGKLRLLENRKKWPIDAEAINGLLATKELRKLICFRGMLNVERFSIRPSDCERVGLDPFSGWKVCVMDSSGAEVGYDTGDGYVPFSFQIARDGKNKIEFWFDANNETLRYAKVEIEKEDYEGNIPNPNLGKMLSKVKGTARGSVVFKCEYRTSINQTLRNLGDDSTDGDDE